MEPLERVPTGRNVTSASSFRVDAPRACVVFARMSRTRTPPQQRRCSRSPQSSTPPSRAGRDATRATLDVQPTVHNDRACGRAGRRYFVVQRHGTRPFWEIALALVPDTGHRAASLARARGSSRAPRRAFSSASPWYTPGALPLPPPLSLASRERRHGAGE